MGYRAENDKIEKRIKILKRVALGILLLCILALCVFSAFVPPESWKYHFGKPDVDKRRKGEMRIHFLDVGQGDCTLIELPDGKIMLIDGGDGSADSTKSMLRYLNALDVDEIDYLVVTHADSEHCGGLDVLLKYKTVEIAYLPPTLPAANADYAAFYAALIKTDCKRVYSSRNLVGLGKTEKETPYPYTLSFLSPYQIDVDAALEEANASLDDDALSAVLWLDYQGVSALFTGDIPQKVEEAIMRDDNKLDVFSKRGINLTDTEILKVAHHGGADSTSVEFLSYLGVKDAVISCGETNAYGHPSESVLARLDSAATRVYRTDIHGHIMATISTEGTYTIQKIA